MSSSSATLLATSAFVTTQPVASGTNVYDSSLLAASGPYVISQEVIDALALMIVRPAGTVIYSLTKLIDDLKSYGIWQVMDVFSIYALHDSQAGALNLIDATHKATFIGGPTWSAFQGFEGNGVDATLEHGIDYAGDLPHFLEHDHSLWLWCMSDIPGQTIEVGANGGGSQLALRVHDGLSASFWSCSNTVNKMPVTSGRGFLGLSRQSATEFYGFKNATATAFARVTDGIPTSKLSVLRISNGAVFSPNRLGWWAIGGGLNPEQGARLYDCMRTFFIDVGAVDPNDIDQPEVIGANHFTAAMINDVTPASLFVEQQALPPADNAVTEAAYAYFPLDTAASYNALSCANSTWDGSAVSPPRPVHRKPSIWALRKHDDPTQYNRAAAAPYPPIYNTAGNACRFEYPGGLAMATAAEEAQVMYVCGYPKRNDGTFDGYLDVLAAAGYSVDDSLMIGDCMTHAAWAADPDNLFPYDAIYYTGALIKVAHDKVWLARARLVDMAFDAYGIFNDMEAQDGRTPEEAKAQILKLAARCAAKGYAYDLYTNPLNAGSQAHNGLDASNLSDIVKDPNVSRVSILARDGNLEGSIELSILDQLQLLKGPSGTLAIPYEKLTMVVGIGAYGQEMSTASAAVVRSFVIGRDEDGTPNPAKAFGGVNFWRNGGIPGGDITRQYNQVVATVLGLPTT